MGVRVFFLNAENPTALMMALGHLNGIQPIFLADSAQQAGQATLTKEAERSSVEL